MYRVFITLPSAIYKVAKIKPDVVHFHDPEILLIAPFLRMLGFKVIYDVHEDNYENVLQKKSVPRLIRPLLAAFVAFLENVSTKYCKIVIAERYYISRFPDAIEALNYPRASYTDSLDDDMSRMTSDQLSQMPKSFDKRYEWFLYTGNVTLERGAVAQLELLLESSRYAICYVGKCEDSVCVEIEEWLFRHGISPDRVSIFGRGFHVPQSLIEYYQVNYDWVAGLAIFPHSEFYIKKELTKFYEYYRAGVMILCTDTQVWASFVTRFQAGTTYRNGWRDRLECMHKNKNGKARENFVWDSQISKVVSQLY